METVMDLVQKLAYFITFAAVLGELNVSMRLLVGRDSWLVDESLPFTFLGSVGAKSTRVQKADDTRVTDIVSFDVTLGGEDIGTIDFGLFRDLAPLTVENFVQLATREEGKGYQGSAFHRVIKDFMIQGGDFVKGDGSGEDSIYGGRFKDEKFELAHYGAGWLSMANAGPDTNTCQFFVTARTTSWLDGKHIVFGKVVRGMWVMKQILDVETDENDKPKVNVVIAKSSHSKPNNSFTVAKVGADWMT